MASAGKKVELNTEDVAAMCAKAASKGQAQRKSDVVKTWNTTPAPPPFKLGGESSSLETIPEMPDEVPAKLDEFRAAFDAAVGRAMPLFYKSQIATDTTDFPLSWDSDNTIKFINNIPGEAGDLDDVTASRMQTFIEILTQLVKDRDAALKGRNHIQIMYYDLNDGGKVSNAIKDTFRGTSSFRSASALCACLKRVASATFAVVKQNKVDRKPTCRYKRCAKRGDPEHNARFDHPTDSTSK